MHTNLCHSQVRQGESRSGGRGRGSRYGGREAHEEERKERREKIPFILDLTVLSITSSWASHLGCDKEMTMLFLFSSRQADTAGTARMSVASSKSPFLQELWAPDPKRTPCTVLGAQVSWRGCHRFVRVRSGVLVYLYVGEKDESLLPRLPWSPHILGIVGGVREVRGTGSPFTRSGRFRGESRGGEGRRGWHWQIVTGALGVFRPQYSRPGSPRCRFRSCCLRTLSHSLASIRGSFCSFLTMYLAWAAGQGNPSLWDLPNLGSPPPPTAAPQLPALPQATRRNPEQTHQQLATFPPESGPAPFGWDERGSWYLCQSEVAPKRPGRKREYLRRLKAPSPSPAVSLPLFPRPGFVYIGSGSWEELPTPSRLLPSLPGFGLPTRGPHQYSLPVSREGRRPRASKEQRLGASLAHLHCLLALPSALPSALTHYNPSWDSVSPPPTPSREGRLKTVPFRCSWRFSGFIHLPENNGNMNSGAWERPQRKGRDWWAEWLLQGGSLSEGGAGETSALPPLGRIPLTSVAKFPRFPGRPVSVCGWVLTAREQPGGVSSQEFVDLYPKRSSPRIPCTCVLIEPTWTLASEGVDLSSGGLSQEERSRRGLGKTRKVMPQCQKQALSCLTLAEAERFTPTQF